MNTRSTLHIHHFRYRFDTEPWDYPDIDLITLCKNCHDGNNYLLPGEECLRRKLLKQKELESLGLDKDGVETRLKIFCEQIDYFRNYD